MLGEPLSGLDLSGTTHTDAGDYTDEWLFIDSTGNYNNDSDFIKDLIDGAFPDCSSIIDSANVFYNGTTYPRGECKDIIGNPMAGLDLGPTITNVGIFSSHWIFTSLASNNYYDQEGFGAVVISPANASCTITPYNVPFDGGPHIASGSCLGVLGETLAAPDLSGTEHTDAGAYLGDPWTFTDVSGNYNDTSGTVDNNINKIDPTCTILGWSGPYDGLPHGASGSCDSLGGAPRTVWTSVRPSRMCPAAVPTGHSQCQRQLQRPERQRGHQHRHVETVTTVTCPASEVFHERPD